MIRIDNIEVWGFEHAVRGMRNPLNSWANSDSSFEEIVPDYAMDTAVTVPNIKIGQNDLTLMRSLYAGGTSHRKYLRQIFVSLDITAPLYWWKEFDTYKVGTTANSCSTMHKIHSKPFVLEDFSHDYVSESPLDKDFFAMATMIDALNFYRECFIDTKDKRAWYKMIQLLPSSYNQKRTVTMTYENIMNILDTRQGHKLDEWRYFCKVLKELPYVTEIRQEV